MRNRLNPSSAARSVQWSATLLLVGIGFLEFYSLLSIALDRFPTHRFWWEKSCIVLFWISLVGLIAGVYLLLVRRSSAMGFRLVIANIILFYCAPLFLTMTAKPVGVEAVIVVLAVYTCIMIIGVVAASSLKKVALSRTPRN